MTNQEIIQYYIDLLIMQYTGQTNLQAITFSDIPASGNYKFTYGTLVSATVAWNASDPTIAGVLEDLTGISGVSVSSSTGSGTLVLSIGLGNSSALVLGTTDSTLENAGTDPITTLTSGELLKAAGTIQTLSKISIMNQLPLIAQNAFNLIPSVQTITFSGILAAGAFEISLAVTSSPSISTTATAGIAYTASNQDIKNAINAILPSGTCDVTGGLSLGYITLSFTGVNPTIVTVPVNTTGDTVTITTNLAYGSQLDTLGKYVGVTRYGFGPGGPITLSDSEFYQLIQLGIIRNNFGSSLAQIQTLLFNFFQGQILVFDYANMQMSYLVNTSFLSEDLLNCFISQGLLPKPMGVQVSNVIAAPIISTFFSFRTYLLPVVNGSPFNTYDSYSLTAPWVSYSNAVGV